MDLFSPLKIGKATLKNRTVMAPMVPNSAGADGQVTPEYQNFYQARSRGGVGYIVLGGVYVQADGKGFPNQLGIHRDELIPGLSGLAETLGENCLTGVQLSYKSVGRPPEAFDLADIGEIRKSFLAAAKRAARCGFQAVELHACHDYWLNYFLSPYFNRRTDEYGGSLENRFRLLGEVVGEIKNAADDSLILGVRLSVDDFMEGGLGVSDSIQIGQRLSELGVDYLSASVGIGVTQYRMSPPMEVPRSTELTLAGCLRENVSVPVIGVGRLDRPAEFKAAVEDGHVQMAAAARAFIADPDFAVKIQDGRDREIRPCLACNFCLTRLQQGKSIRCVVNPHVGRDQADTPPLSRPRRVLVVGGGPAGLTAAAAAARRGAKVRLVEKSSQLGGALNAAGIPPFKEPLADFKSFLVQEAINANVDVALETEIDPKGVTNPAEDGFGPEAVIWAAGAEALLPGFAAQAGSLVIPAEELLARGGVQAGRYLIIGGGMVALETAEYLLELGADVTLVEMLPTVGAGMGPMRLNLTLDRLLKGGANILTETRVLAVEEDKVRIALGGNEMLLGPFHRVVLAVGYKSRPEPPLGQKGETTVLAIGDAKSPRSIREAVCEGYEAAREIKG